jgi:hypothetical protein
MRDACQTYLNKSGTKEYLRPSIEYGTPERRNIFKCDYLTPYNFKILVKQSKMNDEPRKESRRTNIKFKIVEKFGGENKPELMKQLNILIDA